MKFLEMQFSPIGVLEMIDIDNTPKEDTRTLINSC